MLEMSEARSEILETGSFLGEERVFLGEARGRVLSRDVCSRRDDPRFENSAMDGYGVRWEDVCGVEGGAGVKLRVVSTIAAGAVWDGVVGEGEAVRVMTGAMVPEGVDTVVMREDTDESQDGVVCVRALPKAGRGAHIRRKGENVRVGDVVLEKGTVVRAGDLGALAAFGCGAVYVARKPRVAILSTGDEIVEAGEEPGVGQVVGSAVWSLAGLIEEAGGEAWRVPVVRDDLDAIREAFERAARGADLVVSIGGVSAGDFDLVRVVLNEVCGGMKFWKIRMKPGKPLAFGVHTASGVPWVGLPGNPVSAYVGCCVFVQPWVRKVLGCQSVVPERFQARLSRSLRSTGSRLDVQRGSLSWCSTERAWTFHPFRDQRSGNQKSLVSVQALAYIPVGVSELEEGAWVDVERLYTA